MDLTALFLNFVPAGQKPDPTPSDLVDEPVDGVVRTGPTRPMTRLGEQQIAKLVFDYLAGSSVQQLIKEFKINRSTVYQHLKRAGASRRKAPS
mgnify:CR=1 FL=1